MSCLHVCCGQHWPSIELLLKWRGGGTQNFSTFEGANERKKSQNSHKTSFLLWVVFAKCTQPPPPLDDPSCKLCLKLKVPKKCQTLNKMLTKFVVFKFWIADVNGIISEFSLCILDCWNFVFGFWFAFWIQSMFKFKFEFRLLFFEKTQKAQIQT